MAEMTPERLAEIRQREQQATKGPWWHGPYYKADVDSALGNIRANCWQAPQAIADASFIAHARQDIPDLLDALARAQQEIADLREAYVGDVAMSYDYFAKARPQKTYGFYLSFDSREAAAKAHQWLAPRTPGE